MKKDMDLIRKILLQIEEEYIDVALYNFSIDGYDMETVAYHCALLFDGGYIADYKGQYASNKLYAFGVSRLTWQGHEFLDTIRNNDVWSKTKVVLKEKALPLGFEMVSEVASSIITKMLTGGA